MLPSELLNLKPIDTGWRKFSIDPSLGNLQWMVATVPTPQGDIIVNIEDGMMQLTVPDGTTAYYRHLEYTGPQMIHVQLDK